MAAYDSLHYTRYLFLHWYEINNLDDKKASYMKSALHSASMSDGHSSAMPHDQ